jgi:hypothetical protein
MSQISQKEILSKVWFNAIEKPLYYTGLLGTDNKSIVRRFVVFTAATFAAEILLKDSYAKWLYKKDGTPLPWSAVNWSDEALPLNFYTLPLFIGGLSVVLI